MADKIEVVQAVEPESSEAEAANRTVDAREEGFQEAQVKQDKLNMTHSVAKCCLGKRSVCSMNLSNFQWVINHFLVVIKTPNTEYTDILVNELYEC